MKKILLYIVATLGCSISSFATTWYVNTNATGSNNGTNWTNAFTDLQNAISASTFGDEIWVAAGTYKPTNTTTRTIYFLIKNGTKVYGGFNGTESQLSERDPQTNVTVLSGDIATASNLDNSYHVIYFLNTGNQTLINGFTIKGGMAILDGSADAGGGVYASNSSAVVENCRFVENRGDVGGALAHVNTGICTVKNCVFEANYSYNVGGAVYLDNDMAFITDCYFASNQSNSDGGAVYLNSSQFEFDRCVFAGNTSVDDGSAFYVGNFATLILKNSLLVGNYASGQEVISMNETFNQEVNQLTNCTIAHNRQAQNGAGTRAITMNIMSTIHNSIIWDNGGEVEILATGTSVLNCIVQPEVGNAPGVNLLYSDPLFVQPGTLATAPFDTTGVDYHLALFSAGIDYGQNGLVSSTLDLDSNNRIQNNVDLGAYESGFCNSTLTLDQNAPYSICGGTPLTLSVTGADAYLWSTGSTASSITVGLAGNYSVVFEDTSGCRGSFTIPVVSSANPDPVISYSGGNLSTSSFTTYQWYYNGNPINGATAASHIPIEGYGEYTVTVTNAAGCEGSSSYCISPASLSASGPTTFCAGESVTLTANNGSSFVWSTGDLSTSITVTTSGTYSVTVLNTTAGCTVSLSQQVVVNPNPVPTISYSGGNLVTQTYASYQWSFNGTPINGAVSSTLTPTNGNGQYTVTVTDANGCSGTSAIYNYNNVSLNELSTTTVELFPNPVLANAELNIRFNNLSTDEKANLSIIDLPGNVVLSENLSLSEGTTIVTKSLSGLTAGTYLTRVQFENGSFIVKPIVLYNR